MVASRGLDERADTLAVYQTEAVLLAEAEDRREFGDLLGRRGLPVRGEWGER